MYFIFLLLWIIFNGTFTWEIFFVGAVLSALLYWFVCKFMDYSIRQDIHAAKKAGRVLIYIVTLIWEIIKANTQVIHFIMSSKYEIEPRLVRFRTDLKTKAARTALANSITLTPGTITVALTEDEYVIHCLDRELGEGLDDSVFVKQLRRLEDGNSKNGSSKRKTLKNGSGKRGIRKS